MEITTKRFVLRELTEEDGPALLAYQSDPRYTQFCAPADLGVDRTRALLRQFREWAANGPGAIISWPSPVSAILRSSWAVAVFVVKATVPIKQSWGSNWRRDTGVVTPTHLRSRAR